jgi:NTE family protein
MRMMKTDAVFEGGGVRAIAFAGAVCCFEDHGYKWQRIAGTSAGSIVAALLAVGYTGRELKEIIEDVDYRKFMDKDRVQSVPLVGGLLGLIVHKGIHCGNCLEQWIGSLLQAKGRTRFRDISEKRQSRLKIIAADVTQKEILILPDGLARYGIDPMDFEISRAVRMSASIPFYFNPVPLSYRRGKSLIVDGGILSNFPIWLFDVKGIPRWPTIGFRLVGGKPGQKGQCRKGVLSYTLDIAETIIDRNDEMYLNDKDAVRTISIPAFGIKATRFDLSREESRKLYESGYNKAKEFIGSWDFESYIRRYRRR